MRPPVDKALLQRAQDLVARGVPLTEVAKRVGIGRSTLYLYGFRRYR